MDFAGLETIAPDDEDLPQPSTLTTGTQPEDVPAATTNPKQAAGVVLFVPKEANTPQYVLIFMHINLLNDLKANLWAYMERCKYRRDCGSIHGGLESFDARRNEGILFVSTLPSRVLTLAVQSLQKQSRTLQVSISALSGPWYVELTGLFLEEEVDTNVCYLGSFLFYSMPPNTNVVFLSDCTCSPLLRRLDFRRFSGLFSALSLCSCDRCIHYVF